VNLLPRDGSFSEKEICRTHRVVSPSRYDALRSRMVSKIQYPLLRGPQHGTGAIEMHRIFRQREG
jgi:hypothetical protein